MTEPVPLESFELDNGLTLDLLDASRPMAGDRWLVHLVARMEIPLTPDLLSSVPDDDRARAVLHEEFGDRLEYRADLKRHFVDQKNRQDVFQGLVDIVRREKMGYLAHPDFAGRFVAHRVSELRRARPWLFVEGAVDR